MADFMLIYRGGDPDWAQGTPPEEIQKVMGAWGEWIGKLEGSGNLRTGGSALHPAGQKVRADRPVTDMAAAEVKELIGGYSIVIAESLEEASELAKGSPHLLAPDTYIEVRPVMEM